MKTIKKLVCILLTITMISPFAGFVYSFADANTLYQVGDIIKYGAYPQTRVKDTNLIKSLNSLATGNFWQSYDYYSGEDESGSMAIGDWMQFCDLVYMGVKYRGVRFSQYRPRQTTRSHPVNVNGNVAEQYDNGYSTDTTYWFIWQALEWRILDPNSGFVICEKIIDSQPFNNRVFLDRVRGIAFRDSEYTFPACIYENSSIQEWLNRTFYLSAFSVEERLNIAITKIESTDRIDSRYNNESNDRIYMLSYDEVINEQYGFSEKNRSTKGTDYALCQGLDDYQSAWMLRSSCNSCLSSVNGSGSLNQHTPYSGYYMSYDLNNTWIGVRPVFKFISSIINSDNSCGGSAFENIPQDLDIIRFEAGSEYYAYAGETVIYPKDKVTGWSPQCIFTPPSSDYPYTGDDITWTCSDPSKLEIKSKSSSISGDRAWYICNCNIRAIANGTVTLTASLQ